MKPNTESVSKFLDISPPTHSDILHGEVLLPDEDSTTEAKADFEYARRNLYDIIETGTKAMESMADFASQAQDPRAFASLTAHMKELVDANLKLMQLNKTNKEIRKADPKVEKTVTNNNLYVGSTKEFLKMLQDDTHGK
jgi:hypothetical protein